MFITNQIPYCSMPVLFIHIMKKFGFSFVANIAMLETIIGGLRPPIIVPNVATNLNHNNFDFFTKSKSRQLCNKNTLSIVYLYLFYHACYLSLVQVLERSQNEGKTNGCSKTLVVIGDGDVGSQIKELFDKKNREFSGTGPPVKVLVFRTTTTMERNGILYFSFLLLGKKYS